MLRLRCYLCPDHPLIRGRDAIEGHVHGHKLVEEDVQVWWACANGLVLKKKFPSLPSTLEAVERRWPRSR